MNVLQVMWRTVKKCSLQFPYYPNSEVHPSTMPNSPETRRWHRRCALILLHETNSLSYFLPRSILWGLSAPPVTPLCHTSIHEACNMNQCRHWFHPFRLPGERTHSPRRERRELNNWTRHFRRTPRTFRPRVFKPSKPSTDSFPHTACDRFGAAIPCRTRLLAAHFRTHEALLPPPRCVLSRLIVCLRSLAISSNSPTCFPSWLAVWCWYFFLLRWRNLVVCVLGFEFSVGLCCLRWGAFSYMPERWLEVADLFLILLCGLESIPLSAVIVIPDCLYSKMRFSWGFLGGRPTV